MRTNFAVSVLAVIAILFFIIMIAALTTGNQKIFDDGTLVLAPMAAFVLGAIKD
jgi:hypothetical protein